MAKGKITVDEWQAELERLGEVGDGDPGETTRELADRFGISMRRMSGIVRNGLLAGRYVKGRGIRQDASGAMRKAHVYRINPETREIRGEI